MIILCIVFFYKELGIISATIGILIGSTGRLLLHLTKIYKKINFNGIKIEREHKIRIWHLTWPLLIGVSFSQFASLVDNIFASYLQEGAIASLSYAKKVVELPVIIFPYVLSIVVFPYFSQFAIEKQKARLNNLLANLLKWIIIAFLPIAAFFFVYSIPIVKIIFQRGAFDTNSTLLTAKPLMIYSLGLVFIAIETILVIFYYANADTKTPVFVGIVCVIINIILTWIFIQFMGYLGIALAFVVQKVIKNLILLYFVKQKISYNKGTLLTFMVKIIFSFIVYIIFILLAKTFMINVFNKGLIILLGYLVIIFITGVIVYMVILKLLRVIKWNYL
jgi:putative peptidoglycan lipid II flippase